MMAGVSPAAVREETSSLPCRFSLALTLAQRLSKSVASLAETAVPGSTHIAAIDRRAWLLAEVGELRLERPFREQKLTACYEYEKYPLWTPLKKKLDRSPRSRPIVSFRFLLSLLQILP